MKHRCKCCGNQEYNELKNFFVTSRHLIIMCRRCIDGYGVDDAITAKVDKIKEEYTVRDRGWMMGGIQEPDDDQNDSRDREEKP